MENQVEDHDHDRIFTGEPQLTPELDVPTVQDFRRRVAGLIFAEQVQILQVKKPEFVTVDPQTDAELIKAVADMESYLQEELPLLKRERQGVRRAFWQVMDLIDEMEEEGLRQQGH